jgi:hypothetical protein
VGFLRFVDEEDGKGIRGALFLTTGSGEPLDFCFTRIDFHNSFLWRPGDARRHAVTSLVKALFHAVNRVPVLILGLADEIPPRVFTDDIQVETPLCRIATAETPAPSTASVCQQAPSLDLIWTTKQPGQESAAMQLLGVLVHQQDPLEPFERAATGLAEAFNDR